MRKPVRITLLTVLLILTLCGGAFAAEAEISASHAVAEPGENVSIEVFINENPGFYNGKGILTYNPAVFQLTDIVTTGCLFENALHNLETGIVSFASAIPVEGDGVLFAAELCISENASYGIHEVGIAIEDMRNPLGEELYFNEVEAEILIVEDAAVNSPVDGPTRKTSAGAWVDGNATQSETDIITEDKGPALPEQNGSADELRKDASVRLGVVVLCAAVLLVLLAVKVLRLRK